MELRALRRDRAFRRGPELFLHERAFDDCLDRLTLVQRRFGRALLIGCPDPDWPRRLGAFCEEIDVFDPGRCFAKAAGGATIVEDRFDAEPGRYDLCLAIGTLDTVNDLPQALARIHLTLGADGFLLGAMSGGETLPELRAAMRAADQVQGIAVPHVHPRIEAASLAALLSSAGFANPVVDIDRAHVSYETLRRLIDDLRGMGATNVLTQRPILSMSGKALRAAEAAFAAAGNGDRTIETFEILHFAAWTPASGLPGR